MASKTLICNQALSHLGQGLLITNIDSEKSESANVARIFFDVALDSLLARRDWSFARKTVALSYIGPDPSGRWGALFRYPPDCITIRSSSFPSQPIGYVSKFALGADDAGSVVYAIDKTSFFTYTYRNTTTETYSAAFVLALSFKMAYLMAPRLTGGDPFKLGQAAYQAYEMMMGQAAVTSYNEEGPRSSDVSAFQQARNG